MPPRLHWAVLLAIVIALRVIDLRFTFHFITLPRLGLMTVALFTWQFVQGTFIHELDQTSRAVAFICGGLCLTLIRVMIIWLGIRPHYWLLHNLWVLSLLIFVCVQLANFDMRRSLELHYNTVEPLGLKLDPTFMFLFGIYYLQYYFRDIAMLKRART